MHVCLHSFLHSLFRDSMIPIFMFIKGFNNTTELKPRKINLSKKLPYKPMLPNLLLKMSKGTCLNGLNCFSYCKLILFIYKPILDVCFLIQVEDTTFVNHVITFLDKVNIVKN